MSKKTVGAAVMVAPGKLEYQELPYPDHLEPGAMIVKMEMSESVNKHAYKGNHSLCTESEQDISPFMAMKSTLWK